MIPNQVRYDDLPYDSRPIPATHIELLAVEGSLAGVPVAPPARCRVLELGCASGGNLLPMADEYRESQFVGIDLSPVQVAQGHALAHAAGLSNVQLLAMDLLDAGEELGQFDYIIAHGLYSWVPPAVQTKILSLFRERLNPGGVGYLSYNILPGWHHHRMLREMLLLHTRGARDTSEVEQRAAVFLQALSTVDAGQGYPLAPMLRAEARFELSCGAEYFMHELLAEHNEAIWFETFIERLGQNGLAYLADSRPRPSRAAVARHVQQQFPHAATDRLRIEQYVDLMTVSQFRRSMFIHAAHSLTARDNSNWPERLHARAVAMPVDPAIDASQGKPVSFRTPEMGSLVLDDTLSKLLMFALAKAWPTAIGIEQVLSSVRQWANTSPDWAAPGTAQRNQITDVLLQLRACGAIEMRYPDTRFTRQLSARPTVSPLARAMAQMGSWVPSRLHAAVTLTAADRAVLIAADGTRTLSDLERAVETAVANSQLDPRAADAGMLATIAATVRASLEKLAAQAVLIA